LIDVPTVAAANRRQQCLKYRAVPFLGRERELTIHGYSGMMCKVESYDAGFWMF
jgi:hypothetical protein